MSFKIIAHRGLLNGPSAKKENNPSEILKATNLGFDVEIDLRADDGTLYLGHDEQNYEIDFSFFSDKMWIHCKNLEAISLMKETTLNWFWHDKDTMTLTSKGFIWCYPGVYIEGGITVECGRYFPLQKNILGVCTDYPLDWKSLRSDK